MKKEGKKKTIIIIRRGQNDDEKKRPRRVQVTPPEVQVELIKKIDERSVTWVLGTSLAFQFVVVGLAAFLFRRRDF